MTFKSKLLMRRFLSGASGVCLLASQIGCAPLISPAVRPILQPAPQALANDCDSPALLPHAALDGSQVAVLWAMDRGSLVDCHTRHRAIVQFYTGRDQALSGK